MKFIPPIFAILFLFGIGIVFILSSAEKSKLDTWSIQDEKVVEKLPMCPGNKFPEGEWKGVPLEKWPCRIDLTIED